MVSLGSKDNVQENIAARLNKTALVCYRITGLCGLAEAAFSMVADYLEEYVTFGQGLADQVFFSRVAKIADHRYGPVIRKEHRLLIDTSICKRGHAVTVRNLAQYVALMKTYDDDKRNWFSQSCRMMKVSMRSLAVRDHFETATRAITDQNSVPYEHISLPLTRKQENMLLKVNRYKVSILLHPSLIFLNSNLYVNASLKKASSLLEKHFLRALVADGYLLAITNGLICRKSKGIVYVKMVPSDDQESRDSFTEFLAKFSDERLTFESYMTSCQAIALHTSGVISKEVL